MFDAGSIASKLGLDMSGFEGGMLRATSIAQLFPATVTNFLANPLLGVIGLASDLASALSNAFTTAQQEADKLNDMATNVGVAVEALSALGLSAGLSGSSVEAVADAFKFLGKNQAEASQGNETAIAEFHRLGVEIKDAHGNLRPLEELIFDVADGLVSLGKGGAQTNAAIALLGRSGTDLIGTLTQGSAALKAQRDEFMNLGAVVTRSAADSADAWGDATDKIDIAFRGLRNSFAEPLRDTLLPYLNELLAWVSANQPMIREGITSIVNAVRNVSAALRALEPVFNFVIASYKSIGQAADNAIIAMLKAHEISAGLAKTGTLGLIDIKTPTLSQIFGPPPTTNPITPPPAPASTTVGEFDSRPRRSPASAVTGMGADFGIDAPVSGGGPRVIERESFDAIQSIGSIGLPKFTSGINDSTRALTPFRDVISSARDAFRDLTEDLVAFRDNVLSPMNGQQPAGVAPVRAAGGGNGLGPVTIESPTFDMTTATTQLASQLLPALLQAQRDAAREYQSAMLGAQLRNGMGMV